MPIRYAVEGRSPRLTEDIIEMAIGLMERSIV